MQIHVDFLLEYGRAWAVILLLAYLAAALAYSTLEPRTGATGKAASSMPHSSVLSTWECAARYGIIYMRMWACERVSCEVCPRARPLAHTEP